MLETQLNFLNHSQIEFYFCNQTLNSYFFIAPNTKHYNLARFSAQNQLNFIKWQFQKLKNIMSQKELFLYEINAIIL